MQKLRTAVAVITSCLALTAHAVEPCRIRIIDAENEWPVPLVELRTTHNVRFVSDNAGVVAFDLPELMDTETWLHVEGHGYAVPKDGFGYGGVRVTPRSGATLTVKVHRQLPAKRLGRITGGGIFGESQKLGDHLDWREQRILGCDSVQNAQHNGKLYWGWGDTVLPGYPLGRFHMIGATTPFRPITEFKPPIRLRYDYFTDKEGVPRNVATMPGDGPTWLSGYIGLPDREGESRLVASYSKIKPPLTEYKRGLCVWNEVTERFDELKIVWTRSSSSPEPPRMPSGHATFQTADSGTKWVLFGDPFPSLKCPATFEGWSNPAQWVVLTPQASVPVKGSDKVVRPHRGAIAWSGFRKKWVTIFTQLNGEASRLGELWYAEADSPKGPWQSAVRVVTHNKYTFYNPALHPEFTDEKSSILLFEATYTHTFSATTYATPRHDYNQVLYRLDLNEM